MGSEKLWRLLTALLIPNWDLVVPYHVLRIYSFHFSILHGLVSRRAILASEICCVSQITVRNVIGTKKWGPFEMYPASMCGGNTIKQIVSGVSVYHSVSQCIPPSPPPPVGVRLQRQNQVTCAGRAEAAQHQGGPNKMELVPHNTFMWSPDTDRPPPAARRPLVNCIKIQFNTQWNLFIWPCQR